MDYGSRFKEIVKKCIYYYLNKTVEIGIEVIFYFSMQLLSVNILTVIFLKWKFPKPAKKQLYDSNFGWAKNYWFAENSLNCPVQLCLIWSTVVKLYCSRDDFLFEIFLFLSIIFEIFSLKIIMWNRNGNKSLSNFIECTGSK